MRWRVALLIVIAVLLVLLIGGPGLGDPSVATIVRYGDAYRDSFLYSLAADQYRLALDRQPANPIVLLRLCDISLKRGQADEAASYADRATSALADPADVAECRARIAESRGQADRSVEQWSIVATARPADRSAHIRLIDAFIAAHDWPSAVAAARAMLGATPSDSTASTTLGALLALDDPDEARTYLQAAGSEEARRLIAAIDDPFSRADAAYRTVSVGRLFLEHARLALAWRAFTAAAAANPNYPDAFAYLGITYDELGNATLAAAYLDRAIELNPQSAIALYLRGVYLSRRKAWAAARADLTLAAQYDPDNASIDVALGRVLAEQGEYAAAHAQLAGVVQREPDNPAAHLALAELHIGRLIDVAEAGVPAARRAVELAPGDAQAHDWLGWGLHLTGQNAQAESELRAALNLDPALSRARMHLGNLLINVGRVEEGRTELTRAVEIDPTGEAGARARRLLGQP
jgi:tetratricopeptide (TPR) repeat protein